MNFQILSYDKPGDHATIVGSDRGTSSIERCDRHAWMDPIVLISNSIVRYLCSNTKSKCASHVSQTIFQFSCSRSVEKFKMFIEKFEDIVDFCIYKLHSNLDMFEKRVASESSQMIRFAKQRIVYSFESYSLRMREDAGLHLNEWPIGLGLLLGERTMTEMNQTIRQKLATFSNYKIADLHSAKAIELLHMNEISNTQTQGVKTKVLYLH